MWHESLGYCGCGGHYTPQSINENTLPFLSKLPVATVEQAAPYVDPSPTRILWYDAPLPSMANAFTVVISSDSVASTIQYQPKYLGDGGKKEAGSI